MDDQTRDAIGRAYYETYYADMIVPPWSTLAENRKERHRIIAVAFLARAEVDAYLEQLRRAIAA